MLQRWDLASNSLLRFLSYRLDFYLATFMSQSTSTKPYLIRAVFDWCVDNNLTPYIVVKVDERTRVPMPYVRDGQIVLNVAPYATNQLSVTNEDISCQARFNGVVQALYVPMGNVIAIYSRETGQGMAFEPGLISGTAMELGGVVGAEEAPESDGNDEGVVSEDEVREAESDGSGDEPPSSGGPRSHLRVVK